MQTCSICGGKLRGNNMTGICQANPACQKANKAARRAAVRATWERKGAGGRAEHGAATRAGVLAGAEVTVRESELAERAGTPCPVCSRPLGRTGMCWRTQACIDEGMYRVLPAWNPAALSVPRETPAHELCKQCFVGKQ